MDINTIKEKTANAKAWIFAHPKEFYKYSLALIFVCFTFSVIKFIFFPPSPTKGIEMPMVFSKSEEKIANQKKKNRQREAKMTVIVNELQTLKTKRENGGLSQSDSLRIEYLYNQYQNLQNGN
ncbi:MAG: hypothetical protein QM564_03260 [Bergeyella sp.]